MIYDFHIPFYHLDKFKSAGLSVAGRVFNPDNIYNC